MSSNKWYWAVVIALATPGVASAITLIDNTTNNGSFEMAGGVVSTAKLTDWDGVPDVDNWTLWTEVSTNDGNSGIEDTGNASDGVMAAFLQPGNAIYNLTSHVAQEGDEFFFSWDHVLRDISHDVSLVYDDGGTITSIAASVSSSNTPNFGIEGMFTIPTGSPAIGKMIGLGVANTGGDWPEVDNFFLTANEGVPQPGDVDGDGDVDLVDYGAIRDNFRLAGATKEQGDLIGADIVDLEDFVEWRNNYPFFPGALNSPEPISTQVPEPTALVLSLFGAVLVAQYGRRRLTV